MIVFSMTDQSPGVSRVSRYVDEDRRLATSTCAGLPDTSAARSTLAPEDVLTGQRRDDDREIVKESL
jgi:hypothetical protein